VTVLLAAVAAVLVLGYLWDRRRYRGAAGADGFRPTDEVFVEPGGSRRLRVYYNPRTGERQYREDGPSQRGTT
jgi:hypothetical protein